jgi:hypothetical protein
MKLDIYLENNGGAAAQNIIVEINTPEGLMIRNSYHPSKNDIQVKSWPGSHKIKIEWPGPLLHGMRSVFIAEAYTEIPQLDIPYQLGWKAHCLDQKVINTGVRGNPSLLQPDAK